MGIGQKLIVQFLFQIFLLRGGQGDVLEPPEWRGLVGGLPHRRRLSVTLLPKASLSESSNLSQKIPHAVGHFDNEVKTIKEFIESKFKAKLNFLCFSFIFKFLSNFTIQ